MRRVLCAFAALVLATTATAAALVPGAGASTPGSTTLSASEGGTSTVTWTGGPYTGFVADPGVCTEATCDEHATTLNIPADYWDTHEGSVVIDISWDLNVDDFDLYVYDEAGEMVGKSAAGGTTEESVDLGMAAPGTYTVQVVPYLTANATYDGRATLSATAVPAGLKYPETRQAVEDELVVDYPLNVIFVGRTPSAEEVAELEEWTPDKYRPTVSSKSASGGELTQIGAGLLNWNKDHQSGDPYFLGITYNYDVRVLTASDEYAKALFQVAEDHTAQDQSYHGGASRTENQVEYDATFGKYRVLAKGGDPSYAVTDPTKTDLVDAYAVEDWIFDTRYDARWECAFTDATSGECHDPSVIQPDRSAYHDPYYDKDGLNLDRMPQGLNKGSSFFFLDTFTPEFAKDYFRPNAYHTYGTDKVIDGAIVPKAVEEGGSWRITDPDSGDWDGVDYARTWGGRYRFHFVDLGAAPNDFEAKTWAGRGLGMSSDYPHGDPPVWQYDADPVWQQDGETCKTEGTQIAGMDLPYNDNTPCRMMPRLARSVAYGLFFRSTPGYLYRPIPRGDVYWLAVSNWTDFYSRPQWVEGQLTNAPWYGTWWTDPDKLYKIGDVADGVQQDDTLRWLSSATPYARWVGRKNEVIPLYDPTNNQPTGEVLDTSPKTEDLPAPEHHVTSGATGVDLAPEPLYGGEHEHATYGDSEVDLTAVSNAVEKAKASGLTGLSYDDSVNHEMFRDFIDANRPGIADHVDGVNTIPSINMVFEKAYTWALPAIVGGIAVGTEDGEAWGVMNNVNDRFKSSKASYPGVQPGDEAGSKRSMTDASLPTQDSGGGFSYTIEHEAAHNLGLSHPHDGSYGVDRCPEGSPNAGEWECYWSGLGWMYDISAAPTTYAMSYRPYEVEDQDNLQRGHVAEYLIAAQDALSDRLLEQAESGRTTPTAQWESDFERMKEWRVQAGELFRNGDYLHAEYAARNAAIAARGIPQTEENTSDPKLLEAGQVFYFNVNPQGGGDPGTAEPNLRPTDLEATQGKPKETALSATVANDGSADATDVVVRFLDGDSVIATSEPVDLAAGGTKAVTVTWDTRGVKGDRTVKAVVDPADTVAESDETDNTLVRTITVRGNKVTNGSFEQSSGGSPDGWIGGQGTSYDTSGAHATDGEGAVGLEGGLLNGSWTSAPISVSPGERYDLSMSVDGPAPAVSVSFLDPAGSVVGTATLPVTTLTGELTGTVTVPAGVSALKIAIAAAPTLSAGKTTWVDDVWLW
ncbi:MAG TPA: CARDB domain-containing protein [Nocardioidaceae bacterium]|nr:CARDB domain-containing protein [Nocardioidaceae bacterium]